MAGPSYKAAVEAKCKDCMYCPTVPGGWRQQVADCITSSCPLWSVRPRPLPVRGGAKKTP